MKMQTREARIGIEKLTCITRLVFDHRDNKPSKNPLLHPTIWSYNYKEAHRDLVLKLRLSQLKKQRFGIKNFNLHH